MTIWKRVAFTILQGQREFHIFPKLGTVKQLDKTNKKREMNENPLLYWFILFFS